MFAIGGHCQLNCGQTVGNCNGKIETGKTIDRRYGSKGAPLEYIDKFVLATW